MPLKGFGVPFGLVSGRSRVDRIFLEPRQGGLLGLIGPIRGY